jgi:hypothetical protein
MAFLAPAAASPSAAAAPLNRLMPDNAPAMHNDTHGGDKRYFMVISLNGFQLMSRGQLTRLGGAFEP